MAKAAARTAAVFGASGQLGRAVCGALRAAGGWRGWAVDPALPHGAATATEGHALWGKDGPFATFANVGELPTIPERFVDAVVHVAGGFAGSAQIGDRAVAERMLAANLLSAVDAAGFAQRHLKPGGVVVLTGSRAARDGPTAFAAAYGASKAGVHHLAATLAWRGVLPDGARVVCLLPGVLDTPSNRAAMPDADTSEWTPLPVAARLVVGALEGRRLGTEPNKPEFVEV